MKNCLKEIRCATGKTQAEVASELHINLPTYRTYEQGTRRLSDENLVRLATYFRCSVDDILGLADATGLDTASDPGCARLKAVVDAAIDRMPSAERAALQRLLTGYFALSDAGREKLAEESEMMVRSGMYARFGRAKAFSDGDPGPRRETA